MQRQRSACVLSIYLLAAACAPQSVLRDVEIVDGGPGRDGTPSRDGARVATPSDGGRDTAPGIRDAAPRPADRGVDGASIDPPARVPDAAPNPPPAGTALLVVGAVMPLAMDDDKLKTRLEARGLAVKLGLDSGPITQAAGVDLVVLSGTSMGANLGEKYQALPVPVLCLEPAVFAAMRLTASGETAQGNATGTQITITASHPIAGGRTGTFAVVTGAVNFGWGLPAETADRIATVTGMPNRYAVFSYEKGTTMVGMPAPARRVALFVHTMVADRLTPAGWQIFDSAVDWAVGGNDSGRGL
jgi:hypothetical protein